MEGATLVTSTVSDCEPTSSVTGSELVLFSSTSNFEIVVVEKLGAETRIVYVPTRRFVNRYSPLSFDVVAVLIPVAMFSAVIVAFGIPAPLLSLTAPTMSPLITCARPRLASVAARAKHIKRLHTSLHAIYVPAGG